MSRTMQNTISLGDWFKVIDTEYLSSFIRDGGSSVKFAVVSKESKKNLYQKTQSRCDELGYQLVQFDSTVARAHMPQDFFFRLASQVDWRQLARLMILRLANERGFLVEGISNDTTVNVFDAIAKANDLEPQFVTGLIRPRIQNSVYRNSKMAKDFRVCMSHLCLEEDTRGDYSGQPLLDWLTGANTRISSVRPFSIYTSINRNTARYFIESAFYWIRRVGYAGTVVLFDNSRVTVARNPKDGLRYYTRAMTMEHYELLREFIDGVDHLDGVLLVVVTSPDFLEDGSDRKSRGYGIYQALHTRVMDDVRDHNRVNPIATLIRLP